MWSIGHIKETARQKKQLDDKNIMYNIAGPVLKIRR